MKLKSFKDFEYEIEVREFLEFKFICLKSLDQSIDELCKVLGKENENNALSEDLCPYFGVPWEAGLGLSIYLNNLDLINLKIFEIGCGLALPSFTATKKGAKVLASDFHLDVERFLNENQKLNQINFDYIQINWREKNYDIGKFDIVIGSDILYESAHPDFVANALISYLKPNGKIILSDPGRAYVQKFINSMNTLGFKETVMVIKVKTNWIEKDVFVFEFVKLS